MPPKGLKLETVPRHPGTKVPFEGLIFEHEEDIELGLDRLPETAPEKRNGSSFFVRVHCTSAKDARRICPWRESSTLWREVKGLW
ncbi:hypothetical protein JTE90_017350 [Oedothorax gibbosus]|uniref:Uncharacterized protein n=1 Tax=Oedothorax gibbosus TaxID=931172 RepID=A0AAV6VPI0_9ARAC|nr:hypothetical protein JTE90_017350 [Oedothorax gibbosus]